jgi:hypothetical protein
MQILKKAIERQSEGAALKALIISLEYATASTAKSHRLLMCSFPAFSLARGDQTQDIAVKGCINK